MIDRKRFADELARLALIYPGVEVSAPMADEYYRILGDRLTMDQFVAACDSIRTSTDEYFPRPGRFIAAAEDGGEVAAVAEWAGAIAPSSWRYAPAGTRCDFPFSERGLFAWRAMGGDARMRDITHDEVDYRRAEFVRLYRQATPDALDAVIDRGRRVAGLGAGDVIGRIQDQARREVTARSLPPATTEP
ncbi:MAG: hypothetical protein LC798_13620 [Chloroflexi bacterium]|nr:hypothetical protein [Chloroflexota bacterium]